MTRPNGIIGTADGKTLYAINQEISDQEKNQMKVTAFRTGPDNRKLEILNSQSSQGEGICHVHCNGEGTHLFVANYSSGHAASFPLEKDGSIKIPKVLHKYTSFKEIKAER